MSAIASTSLRQASRLCLRRSAAGLSSKSAAVRAAALSQYTARRGYVSETPKKNASVSVDTAIRADQKAFFAETGKLPENQIVPGSNADADAMMSPMAGMFLMSEFTDLELTPCRCFEASHHYGRRRATYLS